MDKQAEVVWALRDGKRGHENQVLGLAESLERRHGFRVEIVELPFEEGIRARLRRLRTALCDLSKPNLVIAAGHSTHLLLLYAARRTGARSVLLMKPSLPAFFFDLCLVPAHDLPPGAGDGPRRIVTRGAINRVRFDPASKDGRGVLLIGGPSREHAWNTGAVLECLEKIVAVEPNRRWVLTTSRRTPSDFLAAAKARLSGVECIAAEETPPGWLPEQLKKAEIAWVSADSVSMVYEALSAGARAGVLDVPLKEGAGKLTRGLNELILAGFATEWSRWKETGKLVSPPEVLAEADRCADEVARRLV